MATRPLYAEEAALRQHIGPIPLPVGITADGILEAAANEMDGLLGQRYNVPITVSPNVSDQKPTAYWLQSINSMLGAGRFLVSAAAPGSQDATHNYGKMLIQTAMNQINLVVTGKRILVGAVETPTEAAADAGPIIINQDAYSQVDVFYDNFVPDGFAPGRTPRSTGTTWPR